MICPKCGEKMERGLSLSKALGLSYISPEKLRHFSFLDEDLIRAGWRKILPSKALYCRSYLCRKCKYYAVDYSQFYDRKQANELAKSLE
jgi:hypothetical protein